ncbi:DNA-directed RNA polymerase subunit beta [PVC group bacterium (ex Bugula neritina AB1)]|nr:DNA-directed RNA polymerase subunit beta [PVC group bacterium (ex Bugula neritina AB1)]
MSIEKAENIRSYAKLVDKVNIPFLLHTQMASYDHFLKKGIKEVFKEVFPIESYDENFVLQFVKYRFDAPKYDIEECRRRGLTYASALKVLLSLKCQGDDVREQEIYLGDIPLITNTGGFVINGAERVVVSQLQRSPGVFFEKKTQPNEKRVFSSKIIPYRGAWIEFEFDENDTLYIYIDRRRKMIGTTFFRALGYATDKDILELFYETEVIDISKLTDLSNLVGRRLLEPIADPNTGEVYIETLEPIRSEQAKALVKAGIKELSLLCTDGDSSIITTLQKDTKKTVDDALIDIFRRMRPGDPSTVENSKGLLQRLFFDPKRYDLAKVGRFKLNKKLDLDVPETQTILRKQDIVEVVKYLIKVKNGQGAFDDIDHLGNRRVITVGELVQNQLRIGLVRLERSVRERMSLQDAERMLPHNLINSKMVSATVKDFFQRSQLSQFMDQVNPLAELTHKRRLSALGPGGLSRERAGFEVRDVHHSHYGRICPIETPEGPNIGLISSLGTYARVDQYGFIETPYFKVVDGQVTKELEYLSADREDKYVVAQASTPIDENGYFVEKEVSCRSLDNYPIVPAKKVDYMDVSPKQLVSLGTSLIPFLEHDDANRALMGSNMQRQAVPLLATDEPCVATGMEAKAAIDSGAVIVAKYSGKVVKVDASEIVVSTKMCDYVYNLRKFQRSNAGTCINQRPLVKLGDKVKKGDVLADGPATENGRLALGRNILVAFMSWGGYNFEDAILVNENLVKNDVYTSVHIEEFSVEARDTKLGEEEITSDIPSVNEDALRNLDKDGVVRVGAEVFPGDMLVGKVTPKTETELTPEEKLLRAIFGEKASEVRDASLTVPSGVEGIVLNTKVFSRKEKDLSPDQRAEEKDAADRIAKEYDQSIEEVKQFLLDRLEDLILDQKLAENFSDKDKNVLIKANKPLTKKDLVHFLDSDISEVAFKDDQNLTSSFHILMAIQKQRLEELRTQKEREVGRFFRGDELPPGVIKVVKVYVACTRRLSVGDKMAGRHGNKGVVAKILPEEEMPFLSDGTPVDIILNPLGVPSRMNLGQILETHLGFAAKNLGVIAQTPIFDSATEENIRALLREARDTFPDKDYIDETGSSYLYDGRTGERFSQKVTVGYMYMLKLAHLVDDKIHARSIGPYSLVTQQPLGGKAQFGGQRFGEMEVWALEAYGAAYVLQEMLTVKSDDVFGRAKMYESIVKGENILKCGTPESFNVLIKELQSLALDARAAHLEQVTTLEEKGESNE